MPGEVAGPQVAANPVEMKAKKIAIPKKAKLIPRLNGAVRHMIESDAFKTADRGLYGGNIIKWSMSLYISVNTSNESHKSPDQEAGAT